MKNGKVKKKILPVALLAFSITGGIYLSLQVKSAFDEYRQWKTRESVLLKEMEVLRNEALIMHQFLDRLRRNPDFQDEVARKELGYGDKEEWLYRFPAEQDE